MILPTRSKSERGQTIVLVAVSMVALLGMAVLAIDIVALYLDRSEAQRTADAAALAGAKMFVTSSFTSVQGGLTPPVIWANVCGSATAAANQAALALGAQTLVGGQAPTVTVTCAPPASANNPQITVTVQQTTLPVFFSRSWGRTANTVTATAVAEAYNPSYNPSAPLTPPIQVSGVKPWLIPNCDTSNSAPVVNPNCGTTSSFVDPTLTNYGAIVNNGAFIGKSIILRRVNITYPPAPNSYYSLNVPINPPTAICPSAAGRCNDVGSNDYLDNIACSSTYQFSCGQTVGAGQSVSPIITTGYGALTREGARCLIHADGDGSANGQDIFTPSLAGGPPVEITGGQNNPNPSLVSVANINRSSSIVTVPLYNGKDPVFSGLDLCPGGTCNQTATIVGFLQIGIEQTIASGGGPPQHLQAVILNAVGCPLASTGTPVSGGGASPVTVRLIQN